MTTRKDSLVIPSPAAAAPSASGAAGAVSVSALTLEQLARVLSAVGGRHTTVEAIGRHVEAGAPTLADGRINLMHYMAWLVRELADGEN